MLGKLEFEKIIEEVKEDKEVAEVTDGHHFQNTGSSKIMVIEQEFLKKLDEYMVRVNEELNIEIKLEENLKVTSVEKNVETTKSIRIEKARPGKVSPVIEQQKKDEIVIIEELWIPRIPPKLPSPKPPEPPDPPNATSLMEIERYEP